MRCLEFSRVGVRVMRGSTRAWLPMMACIGLTVPAEGQESMGASSTHQERKAGVYLNVGLTNGKGDVFSRSSLTEWDVSLFGTDYDLVGAKVEIERYLSRTFLQMSGVSVAYRKDGVRRAEWGHLISAQVFRDLEVRGISLKLGGGFEWGMPSIKFDQTKFAFAADGAVQYRHTYMDRNADVPFVGTMSDGALYPVVEVSVVHRPWWLLFETGMRVGLVRFNFDDFAISSTNVLTQATSQRRVVVPYLFADIGLKIF